MKELATLIGRCTRFLGIETGIVQLGDVDDRLGRTGAFMRGRLAYPVIDAQILARSQGDNMQMFAIGRFAQLVDEL